MSTKTHGINFIIFNKRKSKIYLKSSKINKNHDLYIFVTGVEYLDYKDDYNLSEIDMSKILLLSHHADEIDEELVLLKDNVFAITPVYKKVPHFLTYYDVSDIKKNKDKDHNENNN